MSGPIGERTGASPVTARQLQVLQIIARSLDERGFPPTVREILIGLQLSPSSRQTVSEHLERLGVKGLLHRHPYVARGLTLTSAARDLLARERATNPSKEGP